MEYNCGFTNDNKWFRYRAAAIIVEDGAVLFAGNEIDDYYYSIGGAVHMGETAEDAEASAEGGKDASEDEQGEGPVVGMANPWSDSDDLAEALEGAGLAAGIELPDAGILAGEGQEFTLGTYRFMDGMLEAVYTSGDGDGEKTVIRASLKALAIV